MATPTPERGSFSLQGEGYDEGGMVSDHQFYPEELALTHVWEQGH